MLWIKKIASRVAILSLLFIVAQPAFAAEAINAPHVRISWIAPQTFGNETAGGRVPVTIGIFYEIEPGWHIYWKNPGDSGAAPKFKFTAENASVGPIQWPRPRRLVQGPFTNIGYEKEAGFLFELKPNPTSGLQQININAALEWLICKEECIPGHGTLDLRRIERPGPAQWPPEQLSLRDRLHAALPVQGDGQSESPWKLGGVRLEESHVRVELSAEGGIVPSTPPEIFPLDGSFLAPQPPAIEDRAGGRWDLLFSAIPGRPVPKTTGFLLVDGDRAWEMTGLAVKQGSPLGPAPKDATNGIGQSLGIILLSAFFGGMILNLMPCVLPVLFIKFLSLGRTDLTIATRLKDGWLYTLGVLVAFSALGGALLAVRAAGTAAGWGFQLQSPAFVLALAALFWLMGLNFLGVFELGSGVMGWAGHFKNVGSFGTGLLSVLIAAPCTGPFMGSAIGAATILPTWQAMMIFLGLGAGLAAPYLVLASSPRLLKLLPKPGAWMEKLKQFFAFPMFATVLWLLWVLGAQSGPNGALLAGALLLLISFALWLGRGPSRAAKATAWVIGVGAFVAALGAIQISADLTTAASDVDWAKYDEVALRAALDKHRAVFVDFTAAWCISCQVNRRVVLSKPEALALFKKHDVLLLEADWTKQDSMITAALARFGRSSVPVYAFYAGDGSAPQVLPQILTMNALTALFDKPASSEAHQ